MITYNTIRKKRIKEMLKTMSPLVREIENSLINMTGELDETHTVVLILNYTDKKLRFFLSEYSWLSGIPIEVTETDDKTYIIIKES